MSTALNRVLHFEDQRAPHEVQFLLERELMTLFHPTLDGGKLCLQAHAEIVGAEYDFRLVFEASLPTTNFYSLRMEVSWVAQGAAYSDYYQQTCASWFALWTADFTESNPQITDSGSLVRYTQLCEEALRAEQELDSVVKIQQAILAAIKRGSSFGTSHKEGGTKIYWTQPNFVRSDYGDFPDQRLFVDEVEFLNMLRQFYDWDIKRNNVREPLSEIDSWRLIMRRMDQ